MQLRVERGTTMHRGTVWRPVGRITANGEQLTAAQLADALSAKEHTPISVEDPYHRHRLLGRYVIDQKTGVIAHRSVAGKYEALTIGPGSVIGPRVRIAATAVLGTQVELQAGVTINNFVKIGDRSALLKQAAIGEGAYVGSLVLIGQAARLARNAKVYTGGIVEKDVLLEPYVEVGMQGRIQRGTKIKADAWLSDNVEVGRHVRIGAGAIVGEYARIGHYSVVGAASIIQAESELGDMSVLHPTAWVRDGEVYPGINNWAPPPEWKYTE